MDEVIQLIIHDTCVCKKCVYGNTNTKILCDVPMCVLGNPRCKIECTYTTGDIDVWFDVSNGRYMCTGYEATS